MKQVHVNSFFKYIFKNFYNLMSLMFNVIRKGTLNVQKLTKINLFYLSFNAFLFNMFSIVFKNIYIIAD